MHCCNTDTPFAANPDSRRSTAGYLFMVASWSTNQLRGQDADPDCAISSGVRADRDQLWKQRGQLWNPEIKYQAAIKDITILVVSNVCEKQGKRSAVRSRLMLRPVGSYDSLHRLLGTPTIAPIETCATVGAAPFCARDSPLQEYAELHTPHLTTDFEKDGKATVIPIYNEKDLQINDMQRTSDTKEYWVASSG